MRASTEHRARLLFLAQGILAAVAAFCVLNILDWGYEGLSLAGMNRIFEETDLFCETIEEIILGKIRAQQNKRLFEEDGEYNELKELDIRQYVSDTPEGELNPNTTYYIGDLIEFGEDGAAGLLERIGALMGEGETDASIGRALFAESDELESIWPVSGHALAQYAQVSSNPDAAVLEYYRILGEASLDIADRFHLYREMAAEGEDPAREPSNVSFYVEDTTNRQRYTNLNVKSLVAARTLVREQENLRLLFEGDRRFNIMVSASDHPVSDNASVYFMQSRFTGNNESVLIAYDSTYAAGDELQSSAVYYRQRKPMLITSVLAAAGAFCVLGVLLAFWVKNLRRSTGAFPRAAETAAGALESIPTEIACGILLLGCLGWWMACQALIGRLDLWAELPQRVLTSAAAAVEYWIALAGITMLARRMRGGALWKNSVIYTVIMGGRHVYSARRSSERLVIAYVGFVILNMVFLFIGGISGGIMALILNMAALLYLMRDVVGSKSVREGLAQISRGKLDYRINTQVLTGESREMGEAVNEMGEGLQRSVEAMLEHERLKAELITNVSHDLKTPLTSIMNYVDLLKREPLPAGRAGEYLAILDRKTRRLKQLTDDLIEVSRIQSGNVKLDMQPLQLWAFLQQACGEFEDRFAQKKLELKLRQEPAEAPGAGGDVRTGRICADGAQLWRVFENLFGNAAKYALPGTEVTVAWFAGEQHIGARIQNIPEKPLTLTAQELEERFTRGDSSRSTEGSGLGLSIAKSLTEYMGGRFRLEVSAESFAAEVLFPADGDGGTGSDAPASGE